LKTQRRVPCTLKEDNTERPKERLDLHWTESVFSPPDLIRPRFSSRPADRPIIVTGCFGSMYSWRTDSGGYRRGGLCSSENVDRNKVRRFGRQHWMQALRRQRAKTKRKCKQRKKQKCIVRPLALIYSIETVCLIWYCILQGRVWIGGVRAAALSVTVPTLPIPLSVPP
jgi:hypothetical protein